MRYAAPCCRFYPSCHCDLAKTFGETWMRDARRRFWRGFATVVAVLAAAVVLIFTLVGCDEPARPPVPSDRPSEMYTVIQPS